MGAAKRIAIAVITLSIPLVASPASAERTYAVRILSEPAGATLYFDDPDSDPIGETPYTGKLEAGNYTIILEAPGHEMAIESMEVGKTRKRQTFRFELTKKPVGFVKLRPSSAGEDFSDATIIIDDTEHQVDVDERVELDVGAHKVEVIREGYETYEAYFELEEGQLQAISVNFVEASETVDEGGGFEVKKKVEKKKSDDGPPPSGPRLITAWGGVEWGGRSFKYDSSATMLRDYDFLGARLRLGAEAYPLLKFGRWAGGLGFGASVGVLMGPKSSTNENGTPGDTSDDLNADNSWIDYHLDLRYRYDFNDRYWGALAVGYGQQKFEFTNADAALTDRLADVDYKQVEFGLLLGAQIGRRARGSLNAHFYQVREAGGVQSRFDGVALTAFGLTTMAAYAAWGSLEITATLAYDRYSYSFGDPPAMADYSADSAVDQLFGLALGVGYQL